MYICSSLSIMHDSRPLVSYTNCLIAPLQTINYAHTAITDHWTPWLILGHARVTSPVWSARGNPSCRVARLSSSLRPSQLLIISRRSSLLCMKFLQVVRGACNLSFSLGNLRRRFSFSLIDKLVDCFPFSVCIFFFLFVLGGLFDKSFMCLFLHSFWVVLLTLPRDFPLFSCVIESFCFVLFSLLTFSFFSDLPASSFQISPSSAFFPSFPLSYLFLVFLVPSLSLSSSFTIFSS